MQIETISTTSPESFTKAVNAFLREGWELHGLPATNTVVHQSTWDGGDLRSRSVTTYVQVLKKNLYEKTCH